MLPAGSFAGLDLIRARVEACEALGVQILCCPEAILGGLADNSSPPHAFAIDARSDDLRRLLAPLASATVTTIVGFTEKHDGRLYNAAAVFRGGAVAGIYRKVHPAIRRSVYAAGDATPVFQSGGLTFGIVICNDSNYPEPAKAMAGQGARALFIPSNNALPSSRRPEALPALSHAADVAIASAHRLWVIRADVAGRDGDIVSYGSSEIVDAEARVVCPAKELSEDLLVAEI